MLEQMQTNAQETRMLTLPDILRNEDEIQVSKGKEDAGTVFIRGTKRVWAQVLTQQQMEQLKESEQKAHQEVGNRLKGTTT